MKWSEFESKYPKALYEKARKLCEEYHSDVMKKGGSASRFCNYCYQREGWKCFPCNNIKEIYEERFDEPLLGDSKSKKKK
nr:hypothetical protein [Candidatus Njordarchaeota archaeon]